MELIRTLRDRHLASRQKDIQKQAEYLITVTDFDGSLYIAFNDAPLVIIDDSWTPKQIVGKLTSVRQSYVNAKMREQGLNKAS